MSSDSESEDYLSKQSSQKQLSSSKQKSENVDSFLDSTSNDEDDKLSSSSMSLDNKSNRTDTKTPNPTSMGSNLFIKPPVVPRRRNSVTSNNKDVATSKPHTTPRNTDKTNQHDIFINEHDSASTTSMMYSPKDSFRSCIQQIQIAPKQKIENSEKLITKMLHEYKESVDEQTTTEKTADQEALIESLLNEYITLIALNLIVYGQTSLQYAKTSVRLGEFYLEYKKYPKQAEKHFKIAENIMNKQSRLKRKQNESDETARNDDDHYYNFMNLYYLMSKVYSMVKRNKTALKYIEKSEENYQNYEMLNSANVDSVVAWRRKITHEMAKLYAANSKYANAATYFDKCIKLNGEDVEGSGNTEEIIKLYFEQAKVENKRENYLDSIGSLLKALEIAQTRSKSNVLIAKCELQLAKTHKRINDMEHSEKAESLFRNAIDTLNKEFGAANPKTLEAHQDYIKFLINENRYEEAKRHLLVHVDNQIQHYGDYHLAVNSSYKLLSSIYSRLKDNKNSAECLKQSIEIEELNFGPHHKIVLESKETYENIKKQLNQSKTVDSLNEKPKFNISMRVDNRRSDLELYKRDHLQTPTPVPSASRPVSRGVTSRPTSRATSRPTSRATSRATSRQSSADRH